MTAITESYIEIMNLIYLYPDRLDRGDYQGVGELFADATIDMGSGEVLAGADAVRRSFEQWTRRFADDGTPHTRHCITNPMVEIDEQAGTAVVRYYIMVLQRTDEFPLQPVWANKYEDHVRRVDGTWRFHRRRGFRPPPRRHQPPPPTNPDRLTRFW